jgi:ribosomal protein S3
MSKRLIHMDQRDVKIALYEDKGNVIVHFGMPTLWIGMSPAEAKALANKLSEKASQMENRN